MIVIKDEKFEMVQTSGPFFDLSILVKVNEGKENEREELKLVSHGLPFEACLKQVANHKIDDSKTYTVSEYVKAYKNAIDEIIKLIQIVDTSKKETDEHKLG